MGPRFARSLSRGGDAAPHHCPTGLVSGGNLALHLGVTHQHVDQLTRQGVIGRCRPACSIRIGRGCNPSNAEADAELA